MTMAYTFSVSCPRCGLELEHVANGGPKAGTTTQAVARCVPCRARWLLSVRLRDAGVDA